MKARVTGLGQWIPAEVRDNGHWPAEFVAQSTARAGDRTLVDVPVGDADAAQRLSAEHLSREACDPFLGTTERRVAPAGMSASEAEAAAAVEALTDACVDAAEVDAIISYAITPDRVGPSNAPRVAHLIGAHDAWATGIDAACSSMVLQLDLAAALIETGRARTVLLTHSHLMTRAMPTMHPASPNVGDAAVAVVVGAAERAGIMACHAVTDGRFHDSVLWCRGRADDDDPPWWTAGGESYLGSKNPEHTQWLMQNTARLGAQTVREMLERAELPAERVDVLASVQPRRWVPGVIAHLAGVPEARAPQTFDRYAHLGGAGAITNLIAAREQGLLGRGAHIALYAQGAGFTRSAILLRWDR